MPGKSFSIAAFRRGSEFVLAAGVALVVAADLLFYRHPFGWTAGLFAALLLLALLVRPARGNARLARWAVSLAVMGLIFSLVEEPTPLSLWVTSIAIIVLAMTWRDGFSRSTAVWLERIGKFILVGWLRVARDTFVSVRWIKRHPAAGAGGPAAALWAVGKWVVPLLLGSVFVGLFALANPVVEELVSRAVNWIGRRLALLPYLLDPPRILLWMAVFSCVWALLRVRTRRARPERNGKRATRPGLAPLPFDRVAPADGGPTATRTILPVDRRGLVERCLIVFNLIFAMESLLDVVYLWGGRHLPRGMSFKEYAHRGAYPLIATALLAAAFVLIAFRRQCNGPGWRRARWLVYAWIAQNVLLTFSAGWRLLLLVNASNLTRWRLATSIWLGLVALGLLTIVARIATRRDNAWLLRVNIAMTALVLYACCFANLDGFIADYNAVHCIEVASRGDALGLTYLRELGIESIPALERLSHTLDTPERRAMARNFADELRDEVNDDLADWHGWTFRRWRLRSDPKPPASRRAAQAAAAGRARLSRPAARRPYDVGFTRGAGDKPGTGRG